MRTTAAIAVLIATFGPGDVGGVTPPQPKLYTVHDFDAGLGRLTDVTFSADGRILAAAGAGGYGTWDAQTGDPIRKGPGTAGAIARVAIGGQGVQLATGGEDGRITIVDLRSGSSREVARHGKPVTAVAVSADGTIGASGDADGKLLLWETSGTPSGELKDGGHRKDILLLSFNSAGQLLSLSRDLRVVTWDVSGRRPLRRGTLQSEVAGRTILPNAAAADGEGTRILLAAQTVSEPRGGMFSDRMGAARPGDLRRENALIGYVTASGISSDPIRTGDYAPEQIAVSPAGCFAFFTSTQREQPRLHVWGLVQQGDDLLRQDLQERVVRLALDPGGRLLTVATDAGRIRTWRISGAAASDCEAYRQTLAPAPQTGKPNVVVGSETDPLITAAKGVSIAVLRFDVTALDATIGDAAAEMVAGQLANTQGIKLIERAQIDAIVRELEIQRSGLTTADAVRIGRGLNARKVVMGSVRRLGESSLMLTARLVDVETQQVEGFREVQCQNCREQDLPMAVAALRRLLVR